MISDHIDDFGETFEVMSPFLEGCEDREEFLVVDFIVEFGRGHRSRKERNRMKNGIVRVDLGEDCCNSIIGHISFKDCSTIGMIMGEDQGSHKTRFKQFKGRSACCRPYERSVLLGKGSERF